jgi:hypothetical protein
MGNFCRFAGFVGGSFCRAERRVKKWKPVFDKSDATSNN